jgi:hypothetical protein
VLPFKPAALIGLLTWLMQRKGKVKPTQGIDSPARAHFQMCALQARSALQSEPCGQSAQKVRNLRQAQLVRAAKRD